MIPSFGLLTIGFIYVVVNMKLSLEKRSTSCLKKNSYVGRGSTSSAVSPGWGDALADDMILDSNIHSLDMVWLPNFTTH